MGQKLNLAQKQKLSFNQRQIEFCNLLRMNAEELDKYIDEVIDNNPALIKEKDVNSDEVNAVNSDLEINSSKEDGLEVVKESNDNHDDESQSSDDLDYKPTKTQKTVVEDYDQYEDIIKQIHLMNFTDREMKIAEYLTYNLDESGYFRKVYYDKNQNIEKVLTVDEYIDEIINILIFHNTGIETDSNEILSILNKIKSKIEPYGLFAFDLTDCLLQQLLRKKSNPNIRMGIKILSKSAKHFKEANFDKIKELYDLDDEDFGHVLKEIKKLNPKPATFQKMTKIILPEFIMKFNDDGEIVVTLSKAFFPELTINKKYEDILNYIKSSQEEFKTIHGNINSANFFINLINERNKTLYKLITCIISQQKDFFMSEGKLEKMKGLNYEDISKLTEMDISNISRIVNEKYIQTPFGNYSLSIFFPQKMVNQSGESISSNEIKEEIRHLIDSEIERKKVYSDLELHEILMNKGYQLHRKSVVNYRDQMGIPNSFERKRTLKVKA